MKNIYFIRHAESVMNTTPEIVGGRSNHTPLTEKGKHQSQELGRRLVNLNIQPEFVYSSPAVRTQQTATISLETAQIRKTVSISDALQELDQGECTGWRRE